MQPPIFRYEKDGYSCHSRSFIKFRTCSAEYNPAFRVNLISEAIALAIRALVQSLECVKFLSVESYTLTECSLFSQKAVIEVSMNQANDIKLQDEFNYVLSDDSESSGSVCRVDSKRLSAVYKQT
jgi:hypothetical protein